MAYSKDNHQYFECKKIMHYVNYNYLVPRILHTVVHNNNSPTKSHIGQPTLLIMYLL
jgi:hypothetical protein